MTLSLPQGVLQQLLDMGIVGGLPEDLQWTIRMLLPKPSASAPSSLAPLPVCEMAGPCMTS